MANITFINKLDFYITARFRHKRGTPRLLNCKVLGGVACKCIGDRLGALRERAVPYRRFAAPCLDAELPAVPENPDPLEGARGTLTSLYTFNARSWCEKTQQRDIVEDDDEELDVEDVEIEGVQYLTTSTENGEIYKCDEDGEIMEDENGDFIICGYFKNGIANFI